MIVFENRIAEIVETLPMINGFKVNYEWVKDAKEVNRYLLLKEQPYPVIFLISGRTNGVRTDDGVFQEVNRDAVFILATRELDTNLINSQRLESSYKNVLNPLTELFINSLENSSISRVTENGFSVELIPNYENSTKNGQIDIWDAVRLQGDITINNQCL